MSTAGAREVAITIERGARFVWPDLDAPYYADPAAAVERLALKGWCRGGMTPDAPVAHAAPAGRYLAADVGYLRSLMGQVGPLEGIEGYERAVRSAPDFPDAPRALVMIGFASLARGLVPEAQTAFERALRVQAGGPYAGVATLGRAMALRARGRLDEARQVLATLGDPVPGGYRCEVLAERAALARTAGRPADAVAADEIVERDCPVLDALPGTIAERAESLLALGRREAARALLVQPSPALAPEAQALLLVRGADLAREDGALDAARTALERALGLHLGPATRTVVNARLARIDAAVGPDRALARLETLVATAPTPASRLEVLGVIAATLGDAGRFGDALRRLAAATDVPAGDGVLEQRDAVLARWIAALTAAGDAPGVASVYARHRVAIDTRATPATAREVATALARLGLAEPALRLLGLRDPGDDPRHALAIADVALDAGRVDTARGALARLDAPPGALASELARVAARLAAVERSADRDDSDPSAVEPGLVRTHAATATREPSLEQLSRVDDPVVQRAVTLLAATRAFGAEVPRVR